MLFANEWLGADVAVAKMRQESLHCSGSLPAMHPELEQQTASSTAHPLLKVYLQGS